MAPSARHTGRNPRPNERTHPKFFKHSQQAQMTKVLIVDDEVEVRQFLSRSLANCGYAIREARDGSEALACVATDHPDVVITDLLMPVMDGFELALRIRANPDHAGTEVIFFTGRASPRQVQAMAETAGVTLVVTKPATIDEVKGAVDAALHRKHPPVPDCPSTFDVEKQRLLVEEISAANRRSRPGSESDLRFQTLFTRSLDTILLFTTDGQCLDANPSSLEILGYSWEALTKMTLWRLVSPENEPTARETWRQFLAEGRIRGKIQLLHQDGSRHDMDLSAVAHLEPGVHLTVWRPVV
jgi:PAS domain S-box-containing protein